MEVFQLEDITLPLVIHSLYGESLGGCNCLEDVTLPLVIHQMVEAFGRGKEGEVVYYGTPVSLKSIAQISTPDASSILVQPYDKSSLKVIEKAIVSSNLGLTPNNDGEVIRMTVPQLTSDRRKELTKVVAKQAEEGKVAIRNIRRDAIKEYQKLEKEKKLSEDNVKDLSSDLQKVTDEYMKKIETVLKQKEKELLSV